MYLRNRYYDPATGQFISRDMLAALTQHPYAYADGDPLNRVDPMGLSSCGFSLGGFVDCASKVGRGATSAGKTAAHAALDVVAEVPYAVYYVNYEVAHGINSVGDRLGTPGRVVSHLVALPFVPGQVVGLAGDAGIDWVKGHTVNNESICDEGVKGYINPLHQWVPNPLKGPQVPLPGIHPNGDIDFEW